MPASIGAPSGVNWPYGEETFNFPRAANDPNQTPVHISVPRPPLISPATVNAYVQWLAAYLPAQAGKPGRTAAALLAGVQTGTESADFEQAKFLQYYNATGYSPLVIFGITPITSNAQTQAVTDSNGFPLTPITGETLFGFPRPLALIGLATLAWVVLKK